MADFVNDEFLITKLILEKNFEEQLKLLSDLKSSLKQKNCFKGR